METPPTILLSFDCVLSKFGLLFFGDPMTDKEKLMAIEFILKAGYSSNAKSILIKSLFIPNGWKWTKQWIMKFCNTTDYQWRILSKELREVGCLTYKHTSHGDKEITQTMIIDSQGVDIQHTETQQVDSQHTEKPTESELESQEVEISGSRQSTPIVLNNTIDNTSPSVATNDVDQRPPETQQDDTRPTEIEIIVNFDNIPDELKKLQQWIYWLNENVGGKITKVPYKSKGIKAKTNNSSTWLSFDHVKNYEELGMSGIGFVLTKSDPYVIIDLDNCIVDGWPNKYSQGWVKVFNSYTETSPSGNGTHIVVRGNLEKAIVIKNTDDNFEVYSKGRYMCFTGIINYENNIEYRQSEIDRMVDKFGKKEPDQEPPKSYPASFKNNNDFHMPKDIFSKGCRDIKITAYCGILQTKNLSHEKYLYWIDRINQECCNPPLSSGLVMKKAERLWRNQ